MTTQEQIAQIVSDLSIGPVSLMDYLCLWGTDDAVILSRLQSLQAARAIDAVQQEINAEVTRIGMTTDQMLALVQSVGADRPTILAALKAM